MKKLVLILGILLIAFSSFAQRTITDDIEDAETVNFTAMYKPSEIHVLCTEVGGTSDGTITLQGSVDGSSFVNVQPTARLLYYFPDDTADLTGYTWDISDAASLIIAIEDLAPFSYYRLQGVGTSNDTTTITITWSK